MGCTYAEKEAGSSRGYVLPSQDADCSVSTYTDSCSPQVSPPASLRIDVKLRYDASVSVCSLSFSSSCNIHTSQRATHTESALCNERMESAKQSSVRPQRHHDVQVMQHKRSCHRNIAAAGIADIERY